MTQPTVSRFVSRVVEIEAVQLTPYPGDNFDAVADWIRAHGGQARVTWGGAMAGQPALVVATLEGDMKGQTGDWIIRGTEGEFYPCKPSVFDRKYEPKEDPMPENRDPDQRPDERPDTPEDRPKADEVVDLKQADDPDGPLEHKADA